MKVQEIFKGTFNPLTPELTLILLTWSIGRAPNNASRWQMVFNSVFKGLNPSEQACLSGFFTGDFKF
jgi:hypothetical protein